MSLTTKQWITPKVSNSLNHPYLILSTNFLLIRLARKITSLQLNLMMCAWVLFRSIFRSHFKTFFQKNALSILEVKAKTVMETSSKTGQNVGKYNDEQKYSRYLTSSTAFLQILLITFLFLNFSRRAVFENSSRLTRGDGDRYENHISTFCISRVKQVTLYNIFKYFKTNSIGFPIPRLQWNDSDNAW